MKSVFPCTSRDKASMLSTASVNKTCKEHIQYILCMASLFFASQGYLFTDTHNWSLRLQIQALLLLSINYLFLAAMERRREKYLYYLCWFWLQLSWFFNCMQYLYIDIVQCSVHTHVRSLYLISVSLKKVWFINKCLDYQ